MGGNDNGNEIPTVFVPHARELRACGGLVAC